jgi:hypothetical protein
MDTVDNIDKLEIPSFLRGTMKAKKGGIVIRKKRRSKLKPPEAAPDAERWTIFFHDEAPIIGTGYRDCWVSTLGTKRVRLEGRDGIKLNSANEWAELKKSDLTNKVEAE